MAYVRQPTPSSYFMPKVVTNQQNERQEGSANSHILDTQSSSTEQTVKLQNSSSRETAPPRRSSRQRKPPDRLGITVNLDDVMSSDGQMDNGLHKIKRVLGQRFINQTQEFLVQIKGEPAENAIWVPFTSLSPTALQRVKQFPPPVIVDME